MGEEGERAFTTFKTSTSHMREAQTVVAGEKDETWFERSMSQDRISGSVRRCSLLLLERLRFGVWRYGGFV